MAFSAAEKSDAVEHLEHEKGIDSHQPATQDGGGREVVDVDVDVDVHDEHANKRLNRRLDIRIIPLCCWVYLLNFLDRGTIPFLPAISPLPPNI